MMFKTNAKLIFFISFISLFLILLLITQNLVSSDIVLSTKYDSFKVNPVNLCRNQDLYLFSYVFISVTSFDRRQIIRNTWANRTLFPHLRVAFIVGLSKNAKTNEFVNKENELYGDIIQGDFIDSYRNLSYKSVTAWKWISEYCQSAKFVLKIDDDVVPNTFNLNKFLPRINNNDKKKTVHCFPWYNAVVVRDKTSKFYVSLEEYNKTNFDTYCSGVAYIMTNDIFNDFYKESQRNSIFWIDDIYVGMIGKLVNVVYKQIYSLYIELNGLFNSNNNNSFYLFIQNVDSNKDFQLTWDFIIKNNKA